MQQRCRYRFEELRSQMKSQERLGKTAEDASFTIVLQRSEHGRKGWVRASEGCQQTDLDFRSMPTRGVLKHRVTIQQ